MERQPSPDAGQLLKFDRHHDPNGQKSELLLYEHKIKNRRDIEI